MLKVTVKIPKKRRADKPIVRFATDTPVVPPAADTPVAPPEADIPTHLLGSYGDPKLWAESTLVHAHFEDLVEVYSIVPGQFATSESIRDRIWLHDLLDDMEIPYYIEVGNRSGSKLLVEAHHIYVENKNAEAAFALVKNYNDPGSIVRDKPDEDGISSVSDDGIPQKKCASCGKEIDFDYSKCPYCKGPAD